MTVSLLWLRRDLRLSDHPALAAAAAEGAVVPVVILDDVTAAQGAAARFRWGLALQALDETLRARGSRIVFRRGDPLEVLRDLACETGARAVHWSRLYDPDAIARDKRVKSGLKDAGLRAESHPGHLLFEPWTVQTGQGGPYRVYTPFWKAVRDRGAPAAVAEPKVQAPAQWPQSDRLDDWRLGADMNRGADVVRRHCAVGEGAAWDRLDRFVEGPLHAYKEARDFPARSATSRLSENLTYGEISPAACWRAAAARMAEGSAGAEHFLRELVWREFSYHLLFHFPNLTSETFRPEWSGFPWCSDAKALRLWQQGRTGFDLVDAGLRELFVTGTMHNRVRMVVASVLTKHLMIPWQDGMNWFADTLIDWDPASNAMGWQWVAGCGPDAAPFFRIFNPITQAEKFDPDGAYRRRWLGDTPEAGSFFDAAPQSWALAPDTPRAPIVEHPEGRARALAAYERFKTQG